MNDLRRIIVEAIADVAPEIEGSALSDDAPLRDQVDLDSMDWLRVIVKVHERTGVNIPERDYRKLVTLSAFVTYLQGAQKTES
ncbi:MAG: acyl carrier protein [Deltaproteobacteria bacterium]|nr:acyl carrier protein [Deltaproteobacteria bacterium]